MGSHICPAWAGGFLLNPLRRFWEDPEEMLGPYVRPGMTVLEPGCGMGYFTLPLARLVGSTGRVIALDLQKAMLDKLGRRARRHGLSGRIELRQGQSNSMELYDLYGQVDLAVAIHVAHEVADQERFFSELFDLLKPGSGLLIVEPPFHVSKESFTESLHLARWAGFESAPALTKLGKLGVLMAKPQEQMPAQGSVS